MQKTLSIKNFTNIASKMLKKNKFKNNFAYQSTINKYISKKYSNFSNNTTLIINNILFFTSSNFNILLRQATPPPFSQKSTYININITPKHVKQLKEIISQLPIAKTTTIPPLPFPLNYSKTQQETSSSSKQTP
ncbi:4813_t:CDS:2 [Cetraspora pellucida]|uniref:4813_t:CDS:1 n=1 Tax=Cetraspora pellucida TaxID=1433469 RepID=A0A9N9DXC3_9GLOM|nr:4813_t:CDS:2 [Cetraspora pellucida]